MMVNYNRYKNSDNIILTHPYSTRIQQVNLLLLLLTRKLQLADAGDVRHNTRVHLGGRVEDGNISAIVRTVRVNSAVALCC